MQTIRSILKKFSLEHFRLLKSPYNKTLTILGSLFKYKNSFLKNGFTLAEVMITVAAIAILTAVGIPNFRRMLAKSKKIEAKMQLSSLYLAEKAFYAEFGTYGACLDFMGFWPADEQHNRLYAVGFNSSGHMTHNHNLDIVANYGVPAVCGNAKNQCSTHHTAVHPSKSDCTSYSAGFAFPPLHIPMSTTIHSSISYKTFVGEATAQLGEATWANSMDRRDTWTIDEKKVVRNIYSGY